jgi:hypothetical protein
MLINWDSIYNYFGIKDFIYFISSPSIQDTLFPLKVVFIFFTAFFFCAVIWFYVNSSYIQYKFLQDVTEFLSKETYGLRKVTKSWKKIKKRVESGSESELKLAIIEADDFLYENLQDMGYVGDSFEEIIDNASKKVLPNYQEVLDAHAIRNAIVYQPDYTLDTENAKRILSIYENTIKNLALA